MLAPVLRPLLVLLLAGPLALLGVLASASPAAACSCANLSFKQQVRTADTVFVGEVSAATVSGDQVTYDVRASRVFKGDLPAPTVQVASTVSQASCGLGAVEQGSTWLFLTKNGAASSCGGSAPATTDVMERAQRLLGIGTRVAPAPPGGAHRTRVESTPPEELTRMVAPGAAMVLVGLLGLAVVSRVGRSR
ncbi:hypothetical protein [Nocardioides campestrisoli]|uniref:hypothetical protein n=1 Tax=Nocardioides campestrisoli TaxID=2736757 RepID=UPI0015E7D5CC|nr:hypothetical protein [Nocardioides campestrisoli]